MLTRSVDPLWPDHLSKRWKSQTLRPLPPLTSSSSRACINRLRSSQSDTAAGLVPEPVAIFWRVS